ncbi:hypothetical protein GMD78_12365 [Ornithinibacillus sp. L9]|uniref:HipA-like kinase domain-containing protein n=1 Tax=Ornithinibacillus caprae TaxID=2678566 RepID=A0A6N8FMD3_9BACI|nr:HipA family kinase [Ornithinibacillus caprae]MUK89167.1 hypothetical protein [Ornithinibacillus caprae]
MVKNIEVETVLDYLGEGISKPALVLGSDFNRYIMKKQKVKQDGKTVIHDCMFLNEVLSYQIANYLGVPVADAAIAHLDATLIENDPAITFVHKFQEGIHFASIELQDKEENLKANYEEALKTGKPYTIRSWKAFFDNIVNSGDISKILALDLLIANFDRYGNTGNLLISNDGSSRKLYAIDHGHAFFSPVWNTDKINALRSPNDSVQYLDWFINLILRNNLQQGQANGMGEVFRNIEASIDLLNVSNHSFQDTVHDIESIDEELIDSWLEIIPNEWYVEKQNQIAFYKSFILKQKSLVKLLIQRLAERGAFSNYRGGVLEWKNVRQVGTV